MTDFSGQGLTFKYKRCINLARGLWQRAWHRLRHLPYFVTIFVQLLIAAVLTILIRMAWIGLNKRFPELPFESVDDWLAFLAILFALIQFTDSKLQETEMRKITHSVSTRFIGAFPSDLKEIIEVIENADHDLLMMVDVVGYGRYRHPGLYDTYYQVIRAALSKPLPVSIKLLHYTEKLAQQEHQHKFHEDNFQEEMATNEFVRFKKKYPVVSNVNSATDFRKLLLDLDKTDIANLVAASDAGTFLQRETTESVPFFFWLRDDIEAAFAFNHKGTQIGFAFRTRDTNLIKQFKDIFATKWDEPLAQHLDK